MFHVTFAPGSESSRERKFHLWYFRSWERKYVGTKVPVTLWIYDFIWLQCHFSKSLNRK